MFRAIALILIAPAFALAQSVDVKNVETNAGENGETTTIEIRKGKNAETANAPLWELTDGHADISGEPAPVSKDARTSWQKACKDWQKDFRADNKENKIININCGSPDCSGDAGNKICTSKATYKIKTRLN